MSILDDLKPMEPDLGPPLPVGLDPILPLNGLWPWVTITTGTATLSGIVTDGDGTPLAGVTVTVAGMTTTTDAMGYYELDAITPGTYEVDFTDPGYQTVED
jgi:hypothetical protein